MPWLDEPDKKPKRTLGEREKKILYRNAIKKCENCGKEIDYDEMQVGHRKAYSKGGNITLTNALCLCWRCNNLQGTLSWAEFQKAQNKEVTKKKPIVDKDKLELKKASSKKSAEAKPNSGKKKKPGPLDGPDWWLT